jgi:hypothetical protein
LKLVIVIIKYGNLEYLAAINSITLVTIATDAKYPTLTITVNTPNLTEPVPLILTYLVTINTIVAVIHVAAINEEYE